MSWRSSQRPGAKRRMPWQRRTGRWVKVFLVLLMTPLITWAVFKAYTAGLLRDQMAALQAQGFPISEPDYDAAYPEAPESENGAALIEDAFVKLQHEIYQEIDGIPFLDAEVSVDGFPVMDPDVQARAHAYFDRVGPLLEPVAAALQRPVIRVPLRPETMEDGRPHIVYLLLHARGALLARSALAIQENSGDAVEHLALLLLHTRALLQIPLVRPFELHPASPSSAFLAQLREALCRGLLDDEDLLRLEGLLEDTDFTGHYRYSMLLAFRASVDRLSESRQILPRVLDKLGLIDILRARMYRHGTDALDAVEGPPDSWLAALTTALKNFDNYEEHWWNRLSYLPLSEMKEQASVGVECWFYLELTRVVLGLERYHLAHSAYPEGLELLVPNYLDHLPVDPMAAAPLRYRPWDGGFVIYGVGRDGEDDSGDFSGGFNGYQTLDWGFAMQCNKPSPAMIPIEAPMNTEARTPPNASVESGLTHLRLVRKGQDPSEPKDIALPSGPRRMLRGIGRAMGGIFN